MSKTVLIVAPHADDETLGCGGTILRYIQEGHKVYWLIVTGMSQQAGFTLAQIKKRAQEINDVALNYGLSGVDELNLLPAQLETIPKREIIEPMSKIINNIRPNEIFCVYRNDAHSDHEIVFDAVMAATKSFRYPFIKRVLCYETISETDFGMKPEDGGFRPNVYIDVSKYIDKKLDILDIFESEVKLFPFPRSRKAVAALATLRGAQSNTHAAEAFMLLKEMI